MRQRVSWYMLPLLLLLCSGLLAATVIPSRAITPHQQIADSWQAMRRAQSYGFSLDVVQKTIPLATVANLGARSSEQTAHVAGDANLADRTMQMTLWSQGGSLVDGMSGAQIKVTGDQAMIKQGDLDWQEAPNLMAWAAPGGDFGAFLTGAENVQQAATESRAGVTFTRYTFTLNGPSIAAYVRDQMQSDLVRKGELPADVSLALPELYRTMTGDGELWIAENGLPLRQQVRIDFPPQGQSRQQATIDISYRDYGRIPPATTFFAWQLPFDSAAVQAAAQQLLWLIALLVTAVGGVVLFLRVPQVRTVGTLVVIGSMVITPVAQAAQRTGALDRLTARQAHESALWDKMTAENSATEAAQTKANPEEASARQAHETLALLRNDNGSDQDRDGRSDVAEALLGSNPSVAETADRSAVNALYAPNLPAAVTTTTDSDGDGLTDYEETILGTSAYGIDSDGDFITDTLEVQGFTYAGQTWYTDPLNNDSNGDGLTDDDEWMGGTFGPATWDTDGDNTPDLFDFDNDGDGVPDKLDSSPFTSRTGQTFTADDPFQLIVNGLQPNAYTFVEFQMRPTNPDHLWYAMNVLDWLEKDDKGQVRDVDGRTFWDVASPDDQARLDPVPAQNGDVRLIPMLEIAISGSNTNLPSGSPTALNSFYDKYNIRIQKLDENRYAAYVPIQLMIDPVTGERVGFRSEMLYLPGNSWGNAQQVRLVWAVQALNDLQVPCGPRRDQLCDQPNQATIVHTYNDEWTLTGFSVREERGADLAIVFEDPTLDSNKNDDANLTRLALGLQDAFLRGRDCDSVDSSGQCVGNGQLDLTVAEIYNRFNQPTNGGVPTEKRWGIDNALRVQKFSYPSYIDLVMRSGNEAAIPLLNTYFAPHNPIVPTLLFATEQHFRAVNLDSAAPFQWSGQQIAVQMTNQPEIVTAGLSWKPYQQSGGGWSPLTPDAYLALWQERYGNAFAGEPDADVAHGQFMVSHLVALALRQGLQGIVRSGNIMILGTIPATDSKIMVALTGGVTAAAPILVKYVAQALNIAGNLGSYKKFFIAFAAIVVDTAEDLTGILKEALQAIKELSVIKRAALLAVGALLVVAIIGWAVTMIVLNLIGSPAAQKATDWTILIASTLVAVISTALAVKTFIEALKAGSIFVEQVVETTMLGVLGGVKSAAIAVAGIAAVVGAAIVVGITWGVFIYMVASGLIAPGTASFTQQVVLAVVATVWALITLALAFLGPVGLLIGAILALIDAIFAILCQVGRDNKGSSDLLWLCGGIAGAIANLIYSNQPIFKIGAEDQPDFLTIDDFTFALSDSAKGFVVDNPIQLSLRARMHFVPNTLPDCINQNSSGVAAGIDVQYGLGKTPPTATYGSDGSVPVFQQGYRAQAEANAIKGEKSVYQSGYFYNLAYRQWYYRHELYTAAETQRYRYKPSTPGYNQQQRTLALKVALAYPVLTSIVTCSIAADKQTLDIPVGDNPVWFSLTSSRPRSMVSTA